MRYELDRHRSGAYRVKLCPVDAWEIGGVGHDALSAADRALSALDAVTESPLAAVVPPHITIMTKVLRGVVSKARKGELDDALNSLGGAAKQQAASFVKHLMDWL